MRNRRNKVIVVKTEESERFREAWLKGTPESREIEDYYSAKLDEYLLEAKAKINLAFDEAQVQLDKLEHVTERTWVYSLDRRHATKEWFGNWVEDYTGGTGEREFVERIPGEYDRYIKFGHQ